MISTVKIDVTNLCAFGGQRRCLSQWDIVDATAKVALADANVRMKPDNDDGFYFRGIGTDPQDADTAIVTNLIPGYRHFGAFDWFAYCRYTISAAERAPTSLSAAFPYVPNFKHLHCLVAAMNKKRSVMKTSNWFNKR